MNTNTTQIPPIPAPISSVVSNIQNESNEGVIPVQQILNTPPEIQEGLAQVGNPLAAEEAVPQQNQDAFDAAALAIAQDEEADYDARIQAAEGIHDQNKKKEAYHKIISTLLFKNYSHQSAINILCDISRIEKPEMKNALFIEICTRENWPNWFNEISVGQTLSFFLSLYNMVPAGERQEDTRRQMIKALIDNSANSKEFRRLLVENTVRDASEKETLLASIEQGISIQGSSIKGSKSSANRAL